MKSSYYKHSSEFASSHKKGREIWREDGNELQIMSQSLKVIFKKTQKKRYIFKRRTTDRMQHKHIFIIRFLHITLY